MSLLDPNREAMFAPIRERFDKFFDGFFSPDSLHAVKGVSRSGYPKLDVFETNNEYRVEVAVPGVNPDDISVEIVPCKEQNAFGIDNNSRLLRISGKMDSQYQVSDDAKHQYKELRRGQFTRVVLLPDWLEDDPVATHQHGMLTLEWKKPQRLKEEPKQISIQKK